MRKWIKLSLVAILFPFLMSSCDDSSNIKGIPVVENAVSFYTKKDGVLQVTEGDSNITLVLQRNYLIDKPVDVTFSITELSAKSGKDYKMVTTNNVVSIPANEATVPIVFSTIDNDKGGEETKIFKIKIESASAGYVVDNSLNRVSEVEVLIVDDDCELPIPLNYKGSSAIGSDVAPEFDVVLVPVDGKPNEYKIASAWGPNFVGWATGASKYNGRFVYPATIVVDPCSKKINVVGGADYATGGTGSFDDSSKKITYQLSQGVFTKPFKVDVVLTPN